MIRKGNRKKNNRFIIATTLIMSLVLSACNKKPVEAPQLLEPAMNNESYRPVEYGNIGEIVVEDGTVVPTDYCHFFDTNTAIKTIDVCLGQYIEEGTVLATADTEYINKMIDSISKERTNCVTAYDINCDIFDVKMKELDYKLKGYQELCDDDGIKSTNKEIEILEENQRYEELLYNYKMSSYNERLNKQYELLNNATICARTSGYVTYVKDISRDNNVRNSENVVILSDYEDCYIELKDCSIKDRIFEKNKFCYTMIDGKKYTLKEYEYSTNEKLVADSRSIYPGVRLKFENENINLEVGKNVAVFLKKESAENVLYVSNDSLYEDDNGKFVYVKNDESREIRYIETGLRDDYNTEVVSGLNEGEYVYYSSEAIIPNNYKTFIATSTDFVDVVTTTKTGKVEVNHRVAFSEYEGVIQDIFVDYNEEVNVGGLICSIKVDYGSAVLADMRNSMNQLTTSYNKQIKEIDEQIKLLEAMKSSSVIPSDNSGDIQPDTATKTDADNAGIATSTDSEEQNEVVRPYIKEEITCQIESMKLMKKQMENNYNFQYDVLLTQYNELSEDNDGSGLINVYSKYKGKITEFAYAPGNKVSIGDRLYVIDEPTDPYVQAIMELRVDQYLLGTDVKPPMSFSINQEVEFVDTGLDVTYKGKVVGLNGDNLATKSFINTIDDKVYITNCMVEARGEMGYIKVDNPEYFSNYSVSKEKDKYLKCYAKNIEDTIVLPKGVLQYEAVLDKEKPLYYVWKIVDGQMVKHYVHYLTSGTSIEGISVDCVIDGIKPGDELVRIVEPE